MTDDTRQEAWARVGRRLMVDELQRGAERPHDALHAAAQSIREDDLTEADVRDAERAVAVADAVVGEMRAVVEGGEEIESYARSN